MYKFNDVDMPDMPTIDAIAIDNADDEEMMETTDEKVSAHLGQLSTTICSNTH